MSDQVALITGGATGIGAAVAEKLAALGLRVVICDVNRADGEALAQEIDGQFIYCDVSSLDSMSAAVTDCVANFGVPDYVHLNAGIMTVPTGDAYLAIEDVSAEQYKRIVGVNLDGVYHGLKTLLPVLRPKGGAITITASTAGLTVVPVDPMYTATKYALVGLGRAVSAANSDTNLRVNVICPGVVDTRIVPDDFRKPEFGIMPAQTMAAEIVDLLLNGENGEVRVKNNAERPAFRVEPQDLTG